MCEHPKRKRVSIRWDLIIEIRLVTTDEGPFLLDMWYLFFGKSGGCSVPGEAKGFDPLWDEFEKPFDGFDYEVIIEGGGTDNNQTTLWKKSSNQSLLRIKFAPLHFANFAGGTYVTR